MLRRHRIHGLFHFRVPLLIRGRHRKTLEAIRLHIQSKDLKAELRWLGASLELGHLWRGKGRLRGGERKTLWTGIINLFVRKVSLGDHEKALDDDGRAEFYLWDWKNEGGLLKATARGF